MNEWFAHHAAEMGSCSSTAWPIDHQGCLSEVQLVDIVVSLLCINSQLQKSKERARRQRVGIRSLRERRDASAAEVRRKWHRHMHTNQ